MIQKIKSSIMVAVTTLAMFGPAVLVPVLAVGNASAANSIATGLCEGTEATGAATGCGNAGKGTGDTGGTGAIKKIAGQVVNIFSVIVGIVAVLMIIYGGFRYITSGGDSGSVGNAKNTLIYAIVGLIIVALAQVIVHYVINTTTQNVTAT